MRNISLVFRREFAAYFATPLAYIFIVIFLVLAGILTFRLGGFLDREQADLVPFSSSIPGSICFWCRRCRCGFGPRSGASGRSSCS